MIQITDSKYYYELCRMYEQELIRETGERVWSDSFFYQGFRYWVKKNYNIDNNGSVFLTFQNEQDYIMFLLRWS
jgi:hypothetical protein